MPRPSLVSDRAAIVFAYALVDINKNVLEQQARSVQVLSLKHSAQDRAPPRSFALASGDVVQVSVFESTAGGLFIPAEAGVRPGNFVTIPPQQVDSSGAIIIPYAGSVRPRAERFRRSRTK